ncbi:MAG: hypothetical protein E4G94_00710, partial [ANME-2 cluster archaeon]
MMKEKIAIFSAILLGLAVGSYATISFIIDAFIVPDLTGMIIDLVIMGFSYLTLWMGIKYETMEKIAKKTLDTEWDYKLDPVIDLLTDTIGRFDNMEMEMMKVNRKIDTSLDYVTKLQDMNAESVLIYPGASFKFLIKVLVMIIFTFSALVYVSEYPLSIVHYFMLVMFLLWWALFTSEYHLFNNQKAWVWALAPIMTVPVGGLILDATLGVNNMIGILFLALLIYAYVYYQWASFETTGFKLFDIQKIKQFIINHSDTFFQKQKVHPKINKKWVDLG